VRHAFSVYSLADLDTLERCGSTSWRETAPRVRERIEPHHRHFVLCSCGYVGGADSGELAELRGYLHIETAAPGRRRVHELARVQAVISYRVRKVPGAMFEMDRPKSRLASRGRR
jgi:hypothetical protein